MTNLLGFLTGNESVNEVMTILTGALFAGGLLVFYFCMIKPFQDEKREAKRQGESSQDSSPVEPDRYEDIINDYPTYHRQDGVKDTAHR